jgi:hypothetical protein
MANLPIQCQACPFLNETRQTSYSIHGQRAVDVRMTEQQLPRIFHNQQSDDYTATGRARTRGARISRRCSPETSPRRSLDCLTEQQRSEEIGSTELVPDLRAVCLQLPLLIMTSRMVDYRSPFGVKAIVHFIPHVT